MYRYVYGNCYFCISNKLFMTSKTPLLIIAGLLVGLVAGYGGFSALNSPKIDDYLDTIDDYAYQLTSLNTQLNIIEDDYSDLEQDYDDTSSELQVLQDEFDDLSALYSELELSHAELLNKYELAIASLPLTEAPLSTETIDLDYNWYFKGRKCTVSLSIPESMYDYYHGKDRVYTDDYSIYVTHPYDDEYINSIIQKMNFLALERGYSEIEKINMIISFVQSLPYTSDNVTTPFDEYPRYPLETLVDYGGDCEDTSILTASLLDSLTYDIILISPPGHMAVGVNVDTSGSYYEHDGERYYYLETTSEGWEIGDLPDDYSGASAYLYELAPTAICTHNWTAQWKGTSQLEVTITVTNEGTAMASDILLYASFDAGEDYVWNEVESSSLNLNVGKSYTVTLTLDVPEDENTRLIVGVADAEGYSIDESFSDWFDT